ncbi:LysM peptidoglycan-binding domain-containing protein [candidate division KSB1 bacterium]|nr:LysM peptidoglycan-binding domain-containing protein [candidate division KSB1 bacterium]
MKLVTKGIIGLFALNFFMGSLRQEGIITGTIYINYPRLFKRIGSNFCVEFVSSNDHQLMRRETYEPLNFYFEDEPERRIEFESEPGTEYDYDQDRQWLDENFDINIVPPPESKPSYHVLRRGETLISLSSMYGVPWREIKEANRIRNARRIRPGQRILIPTRFEGNWSS